MQAQHYDVIVIGGGTAGLAAWRSATAEGAHAALVDGGTLGTTCARIGCMPSKLLIAASHAAEAARGAHRFGADIAREPVVDGAAVFERVRRERDRFVGFVMDSYDKIPAEDLYRDNGTFQPDGSLLVGDKRLTAHSYVFAVGARPRRLPHLDALGDRVQMSWDVFEWTELPKRVAFFGPGVIGLELGLALARLGVEVFLFGVGGFVGPISDPDVRQAALDAFREHVFLDPDAVVHRIERSEHGVRIEFDDQGEHRTEDVDVVIQTVGQIPNTDRLNLHHVGLSGRLDIDESTGQIGDTRFFVAGDANPNRALLHEASDEGRIAGRNAARFPQVEPQPRRSKLAIAFTDPDIALVGQRYAELDPEQIVVGQVSYDDQGRARTFLRNRGHLSVYADKQTGRFLGAEMVAPDGEHLAHLLAWAHQQQLTIEQLLDLPFYHPVVQEGVRTALRDANTKLLAAKTPELILEA